MTSSSENSCTISVSRKVVHIPFTESVSSTPMYISIA
jgi:hypothetical protein